VVADDKTRNPRSEIRKKPEIRSPKLSEIIIKSGFGLRTSTLRSRQAEFPASPGLLQPKGLSDFGLRPSFGFRISDFGFRGQSRVLATAFLALWLAAASAWGQVAYFADGYHGGIYGHYPPWVTQFMVDSLRQHPDWKLNLEIEPETWDFARTNTPEAYQAFKALAADQTTDGRIEFVNPAYGQSYLWNLSGESVIQQFARGMSKIREHFPNARFTTYCSEEPCFTSALPGILKSFGYQYAVLKNPNTCWGGYSRAHGRELLNWVGPDGTAIRAVPRYGIESLKPESTWETIAAANATNYIQAAFQDGIEHPVGMCLQDAGWRGGPWLNRVHGAYEPTEYVTWREYFEKHAVTAPAEDWRLSQEDVQVSLVWGAQVLQRIAQQVRRAENKIVMAEKLATMASIWRHEPWPAAQLDEGWRSLLLSQHHDCWIVPYNGRSGSTWADKVSHWTDSTLKTAEDICGRSTSALMPTVEGDSRLCIRVFNTMAGARSGLVVVDLPQTWQEASARVIDGQGRELPSQVVGSMPRQLLFKAAAPSLGYSTYRLEQKPMAAATGAQVIQDKDGVVRLETDYYSVALDEAKGGTVRSLVARKLGNRELVDQTNYSRFNEIRGYFRESGKFCSSADAQAKIEVLERGPVRVSVRITGQVAGRAITQWLSLTRGEPRIDCRVRFEWDDNPGIGTDYAQGGGFRREDDRRAFYNDRFKLLVLFPLNLRAPKVFKDAPFDVTESRLTDTFFDRWTEIKNNVILKWVDACDTTSNLGMALLTEHTTSYVHGLDHPLALTLQYSGVGLWGREYSMRGPTDVSYALLPHAGDWQAAKLWPASDAWNEPLIAQVCKSGLERVEPQKSLLVMDNDHWEVPVMRAGNGGILVRLFNASTDSQLGTIRYAGPASKVELVQLNGDKLKDLATSGGGAGQTTFKLALPPFGIGTLRITP
jgi:alpha-mannosidase